MKAIAALAVLVLVAGCASISDNGWSGSGAEPFDGAYAACETQTQGQGAAAFDACMAEKGWTRR